MRLHPEDVTDISFSDQHPDVTKHDFDYLGDDVTILRSVQLFVNGVKTGWAYCVCERLGSSERFYSIPWEGEENVFKTEEAARAFTFWAFMYLCCY